MCIYIDNNDIIVIRLLPIISHYVPYTQLETYLLYTRLKSSNI